MSEPIDMQAVATAFRRSVYRAYTNTLIGSPPQKVRETYDRMKNPRVGDWVIEASTVWMPAYDMNGLGLLEEIADEPVDFGDPEFVWNEEEEGRPHPTEKVYYLRTLDGRRFRWINAIIIAAPVERRKRR